MLGCVLCDPDKPTNCSDVHGLPCMNMRQTLAAVTKRTDLRREAGRAREQDLADVCRAQQQLEAADCRGAGADAGRREHHVHVTDLAVLPATGQSCFTRLALLMQI